MPLSKKTASNFAAAISPLAETKGRKLADRRLKELKGQIGCLTLTDDAKFSFKAVVNRWLDSIKHSWPWAQSRNAKFASKISPRFSRAFRKMHANQLRALTEDIGFSKETEIGVEARYC